MAAYTNWHFCVHVCVWNSFEVCSRMCMCKLDVIIGTGFYELQLMCFSGREHVRSHTVTQRVSCGAGTISPAFSELAKKPL